MDPNLPLIDLHRHLDGNVRLETILDMGRQHNLPLPAWEVDGLRPHVQITEPALGVMAFIAKFKWMMEALVDTHACRRIAYENVEDAAREGLDYVELRFSPVFMAEAHGLNLDAVVEAVVEGVRQGERDFGIKANLIGIISRTYGVESGWVELDALLSQRDQLVALDLAGDEANFPARLFQEHFWKARDAGWQITVHAGEIAGPESIWDAIQELGASRIGHGVCAVHDPQLMDYLRDYHIGIEVNLTSNLHTMTVPSLQEHPARFFMEHGLLVTLNTDDPGVSAIDLAYEYQVAAPQAGLSSEQIRKAQQNALLMAFLSPEEKEELRVGKL